MKRSPDSYSIVSCATCSHIGSKTNKLCTEPVWIGSRHGFCIGHALEPTKSVDLFRAMLSIKLHEEECVFENFIFPYSFTLRKNIFTQPVRFINCTFLGNVRFEKVQFRGTECRFEDCTFLGSTFAAVKCRFLGHAFHWSGNVVSGTQLIFQHCFFQSNRTAFIDSQFDLEKSIAFQGCMFSSLESNFESLQLHSAMIVFQKNASSGDAFRFKHTSMKSDLCVFHQHKLKQGILSFEESDLQCQQMVFSLGNWRGSALRFYKTKWSGDDFKIGRGNRFQGDLQICQSRFVGKDISFAGFETSSGRFDIQQSHFIAEKQLTFNDVFVNSGFTLNESSVKCPNFAFEHADVSGEEFQIQNSLVQTDRTSFFGSRFNTNRVSFTRSTFNAAQTSFSHCLFKNRQASWQAAHFIGQTVDFCKARFDARRVSFQRAEFQLHRLSFNDTNFCGSNASFWQTDFGRSHVTFENSVDANGQIYFMTDLSRVHLKGAKWSNCRFDNIDWPQKGVLKRYSSADESPGLKRNEHAQLRELYQWIAKQYRINGDLKMEANFLFASHEMGRLSRLNHQSRMPNVRLELERWVTGYGLGFMQAGIVRGGLALCAFVLPVIAKMR